MEDRCNKIMQNQLLGAWARISAAFGPAIAIALLCWVANTLVTGQRDAAIQAAEQARMVAQVAELETYRREAFARGQANQRDLAAMRELVTELRADFRREIDRLAARIDQQRPPRQ